MPKSDARKLEELESENARLQEQADEKNNTIHRLIMRNVCESDPADPDNERTVSINYEILDKIIRWALEDDK